MLKQTNKSSSALFETASKFMKVSHVSFQTSIVFLLSLLFIKRFCLTRRKKEKIMNKNAEI